MKVCSRQTGTLPWKNCVPYHSFSPAVVVSLYNALLVHVESWWDAPSFCIGSLQMCRGFSADKLDAEGFPRVRKCGKPLSSLSLLLLLFKDSVGLCQGALTTVCSPRPPEILMESNDNEAATFSVDVCSRTLLNATVLLLYFQIACVKNHRYNDAL